MAPGFNFVGLDAHAADLYLRINAPEDLDLAVRTIASKITGAVQQVIGINGPRILYSQLPVEFLVAVIAVRAIRCANRDLSRLPQATERATVPDRRGS